MLIIPIHRSDMTALRGKGVECKINGEPVILRLDNGYLCYYSDGINHRCKVLTQSVEGDQVHFFAASHGAEDEEHSVLVPDEDGNVGDLLAKPKPATITAAYKGATFSATIDSKGVDEIVAAMERHAKGMTDPRANAREWIVQTIERNDHLKEDIGGQLGFTLLWLACTSPGGVGDLARQRAKQGGTIAYEITGGEPGYGLNFRLIIDPDPDAAMPPTPKHPLPGLPGGPQLH